MKNPKIAAAVTNNEIDAARKAGASKADIQKLSDEAAKANATAKEEPKAPLMRSEKEIIHVLRDVQKTTDKLEKSQLPKVTSAVVDYLNEKSAQSGNAKLIVTQTELRQHLYDLVEYRRRDENGTQIGSSSFEHIVDRAVMAALLIFNEKSGFILDDKLGIAAPENKIVPTLKVANAIKGGTKEVANMVTDLVPVPIRVIEAKFREEFPTAGKGKGRQPHKNNGQGVDTSNLANIPAIAVLQRAAEILKGFSETKTPENLRGIIADIFMYADKIAEEDAAAQATKADERKTA